MPLAPLSRLVNVTVVETEPPEFTSTRLLHKEHCILQGKKTVNGNTQIKRQKLFTYTRL